MINHLTSFMNNYLENNSSKIFVSFSIYNFSKRRFQQVLKIRSASIRITSKQTLNIETPPLSNLHAMQFLEWYRLYIMLLFKKKYPFISSHNYYCNNILILFIRWYDKYMDTLYLYATYIPYMAVYDFFFKVLLVLWVAPESENPSSSQKQKINSRTLNLETIN